jgi:hypothetical protein
MARGVTTTEVFNSFNSSFNFLLGDVLLLLDGVFSMAPKTFLEVYEFIMVPFNRFLMLHLQG